MMLTSNMKSPGVFLLICSFFSSKTQQKSPYTQVIRREQTFLRALFFSRSEDWDIDDLALQRFIYGVFDWLSLGCLCLSGFEFSREGNDQSVRNTSQISVELGHH